jgi:methylthioribose-1-phosphate isomerase
MSGIVIWDDMEEQKVPLLADRSRTVWLDNDKVVMLDRRKLPEKIEYLVFNDYEEVARAIEDMVIQGAPPIAFAAGYGLALTAIKNRGLSNEMLKSELERAAARLKNTRPTGSDLFSVLDESLKVAYKAMEGGEDVGNAIADYIRGLIKRADDIARKCGKNAASLIDDGDTILTHCYAGSALVYMFLEAKSQGKRVKAIATETRPYLQGARLTSSTLKEIGIPVTLITDNMVAYCMWKGMVQKFFTAADRIALDGSIANKVGTYQTRYAHMSTAYLFTSSAMGGQTRTPQATGKSS